MEEEEPPAQGPGLRSRAQPVGGGTGSSKGLAPRGTGAGGRGALFVEAQSRGRVAGGEPSTCRDTKPAFPPLLLQNTGQGLSGGPGVKNPRPSARGMALIPGWKTKIPHALGQ